MRRRERVLQSYHSKEWEIPGQQPAVREPKIKEQDQIIPKDQMQEERPRDTRAVNYNKVRKETEKHARADEPTIPIPYPQWLKKGKLEKQFAKFLDIFKKLQINIPFIDALENMPSYVKFMKNDIGM